MKAKKSLNQEKDEKFYYIEGYTSNEVPFDITWEEAIKGGLVEENKLVDDSKDLPF
ncbi:hypothetical protein [Clostridium sp.]|uniref:hypothetical protein n=1 Tax=Clostridium sp. TaxID=1506 RepID=UPI003464375A